MKQLFILFAIVAPLLAIDPVYLTHQNKWAETILQSLTLQQKIGQLFVIAAASNFTQPTESLASALRACPYNMNQERVEHMIEKYHVGGVVFLFKSDPETQMALTRAWQHKAQIPLLIAQDAEWGLSMRLDYDPAHVVRYPRNMTLGAVQDTHLIYEMGYEVGRQCAAIGVHMNFAPVVDVNNNPANPVIHDRSFGDDPARVAQLAALYARGLHDAGVLACIKHFPGHGDTTVDSHLELPVITHDRARLDAVEMWPFKELINQGIDAVMLAHLAVPALDATNRPSSVSYAMVTELLKNGLGFKGLVITDGLGMEALTKHYQPGELELEAFLAGNDILLCPLDVPRASALIEQAIHEGRVSETELDRRVLKILQAKAWVLDRQQEVHKNISDVQAFLTRPEAYELQRKLYRGAITVVKDVGLLSLSKQALDTCCVVQIGVMPEDAFGTSWARVGCVMYRYDVALKDHELQDCLRAADSADTVVIGIGDMNKCAHKQYGIADTMRALVTQLKAMGKRVVVIICGTPYSVSYFNEADTIVVAYEDAPAAQEAAVDVVVGVLQATGMLPVLVSQ